MMKATTFVKLSLLITLLSFSHISLVCCANIGDKATATFTNLSGTMTFTQIKETVVLIDGKFNKGFPDTDTNSDNYSLELDILDRGHIKISFTRLGAQIAPPGTTPFEFSGNAILETIAGPILSINHLNQTLDTAVAH
ncbi:7274_t:CDS:1 [Acaulospora morrowiae]|uniref:7274_t:CDS:1 n=1 Tax=Acaulospora morrowiae TaxID=94023 RepID=A0A9N8VMQ7_9GLOM|nr:7274_t:CDS:1 [Acaulospora morrowiae]